MAEVIKVPQSITIESSILWPLGPVIKPVLRPESVRTVNTSFWSYLSLKNQGFREAILEEYILRAGIENSPLQLSREVRRG